MKFIPFMTATLLLCTSAMTSADDEPEHAEIVTVIDAFFAAMTARDVHSMRSILAPGGRLFGYRETRDGLQIISPSHEEYLDNIQASSGKLVERYWNPRITVSDRMASAWTPYDLYRDGVFSHCGTNHFNFLKTDSGWTITGVVFSMKTADCPDSPLGPFEEE